MFRFNLCVLSMFILLGCKALDSVVPLPSQCTAISTAASVGVSIGIRKTKAADKVKEYKKYIIEKIMPIVQDKKSMTVKEWEELLAKIDKETDDAFKSMFQDVILVVSSKLDPSVLAKAEKEKELSLGDRFVYYLRCALKGLLRGLSQKVKSVQPVSLKQRFKMICQQCAAESSKTK